MLGAQLCEKIVLEGYRPSGASIAQRTKLGWFFFGRQIIPAYINPMLYFRKGYWRGTAKFWEIGEVEKETPLTRGEMTCEKHFRERMRRSIDGKYTVRTPFRQDPRISPRLTRWKDIAVSRLLQLEKRFKRDTKFEILYRNCINENIQNGFLPMKIRLKNNIITPWRGKD